MGFNRVEDSRALTPKESESGDWRSNDEENAAAMISALHEAAEVPLEDSPSATGVDTLPEWFDAVRYKRGADTFEKNIFVMFGGKMAGLLTLLAVPSIVKLLELTKKSSDPDTAFRRYIDTVRHMLYWYRTDITDPESPARRSLQVVRGHHLRASAAARRAGLGSITQLDLALTQFAFFGYIVLRREKIAVHATEAEILDFLHFWRTIGYFVGLDDRFNLGRFDQDLTRSDEVLDRVCATWIAPALTSPLKEFESMSRALITGMWCMMPILHYEAYVYLTQELAGVEESQRRARLTSTFSSCVVQVYLFISKTLTWPFLGGLFRAYHNASLNFAVYMSTNYPILAWYSFPGNKNTQSHKLVQRTG